MNLVRSSMYKQQIRQISTTGMLGDNFTQGFPAILFKALLDGQKKPSSNALQRFQGILIRTTMSKLPAMPSERCLQQIPDQFGLCCLECSAGIDTSISIKIKRCMKTIPTSSLKKTLYILWLLPSNSSHQSYIQTNAFSASIEGAMASFTNLCS